LLARESASPWMARAISFSRCARNGLELGI
jgi:hypothetical protein